MVQHRILVAVAQLALVGRAAAFNSDSAGSAILASSDASADGSDLNMNPIRRVVTMLQKMAQKVDEEAKKEEALFNKFMCYCRTSGGDLAKSIAESSASVPQVQHDIEEGEQELVMLKSDVKSHQEDRVSAKAAMDAATNQRDNELKTFVEVSTEHKTYLDALARAIPAIEKGMSGGALLQAQSTAAKQLRQAVASSAAVTEYDRQVVMSFLMSGAVDRNGYIPKSSEITGILKTIQEDFQKTLDDVTNTENEAVKIYGELMAAKNKQVETLGASIEVKMQRTGDLQVQLANMRAELTETQAALVADQKLAGELETSCSTKEGEWQERKKLSADELIAIHETIKILNDDDALELFKKTLPSASLLQVQTNRAVLAKRALAALSHFPRNGPRPSVDFLMLALSGKKVDFSKVLKMIDGMVSLLKQEQVDDDSKKEYCEKSIDSTEDKVKALKKTVEDLEISQEESLEAIKTLDAEVAEMVKGVAEMDKNVAEETDMRKAEHEEFKSLMKENGEAKELLNFAKNRLNKFYNPAAYKEAPKTEEEAPAALVQVFSHRSVEPIAPPPETWGAYQTKGQESTGVIGMVDLLIKDLDKEMTEAEVEEKNSQKAYEEMMQDAASKRAADVKAIAAKQKARADFEESKVADKLEHDVTSKELQATHMYEMELHQECDWLQQNYDLRKTARAEEADSLNQAKAILSGADFSFMQRVPVAPARRLRGA